MIYQWLIWSVGIGLLVGGCAGPLKQFTYQASELSRTGEFTRDDLFSEKIGVLTATGVENYRLVIGSSLAAALRELDPNVSLVTSDQTANLINRANLSQDYTRMLKEHKISGILEMQILHRMREVLGVRYLILPHLIEYEQDTSTRISVFGVRFMQTRSSTLRVMAQIWNSQSGEMVWEGSAEVTLAGEDIREKPISFDEVSLSAWRALIKKLP
jgi:hypothetical protein